jgi:hypothetical protein
MARFEYAIERDNLTVRDTVRGHKFLGGRIVFAEKEFERYMYLNFTRSRCIRISLEHS